MSEIRGKKRVQFFMNLLSTNLNAAISAYKDNTSRPFGYYVHLHDCRTPLFKIQALARLLDRGKKKNIRAVSAILSISKTLEDMIGRFDFAASILSGNEKWNFPEAVKNQILIQYGFALGTLEECLLQFGWITRGENSIQYDDFGMEYLKDALKEVSFPSSKKERKHILGFFKNICLDIDEGIRAKTLDLTHLEDGIHEFRRDIRWLSIYASALSGKVVLSNQSEKDPFQEFITPEYMEIKHNILTINDKEKNTLNFLQGGFYALGRLISDLGTIKDKGLITEYMVHLGLSNGMNAKAIKKLLSTDYQDAETTIKLATEKINRFVLEEDGFLKLAGHFEAQLSQ
jgi:hypothetical protein